MFKLETKKPFKKYGERLYCINVIPFGFEPKTYCLEGSCSIQLSYGTGIKRKKFKENLKLSLSGRQDSNLRPPGPKPGAMTGLRYAPNTSKILRRQRKGFFVLCGCFFKKRFTSYKLSTTTQGQWSDCCT